jgi:hypothetical protein
VKKLMIVLKEGGAEFYKIKVQGYEIILISVSDPDLKGVQSAEI